MKIDVAVMMLSNLLPRKYATIAFFSKVVLWSLLKVIMCIFNFMILSLSQKNYFEFIENAVLNSIILH